MARTCRGSIAAAAELGALVSACFRGDWGGDGEPNSSGQLLRPDEVRLRDTKSCVLPSSRPPFIYKQEFNLCGLSPRGSRLFSSHFASRPRRLHPFKGTQVAINPGWASGVKLPGDRDVCRPERGNKRRNRVSPLLMSDTKITDDVSTVPRVQWSKCTTPWMSSCWLFDDFITH